jgi:hypothetical protein
MTARSFRAFLAPLASAALLAGCADRGSFPSLAPRPVERLSNDEPVRTTPFVAADPQLSAQVAQLLADARRGQTEFQAALPAARGSVGRAGASGTESWIEAQQAMSRIEAARAASVIALAQLDRLSIDRARRPTNAGDFAAVLAAVEQAQALVAAQQVEIDRLRSALRPV